MALVRRSLPASVAGAVAIALVAGLAPTSLARANPFDQEVAARRGELERRAGRPGAITSVLGILDLWDWVDDRGAISALLDAAKDDARQRHDVRARASFLRAIVAESLGDRDGARRLRGAIGLVTDWLVLGPFDNEGRAADRQELPPERDLAQPLDEQARYPGKQHPVSWRRFPASGLRQGMVVLDAALQPEQHVVGYATTFVRVERDVVAALRVGSTGAITAWAGSQRVLSSDQYRPPRLDQDVAAVPLRAGWNRLTVKLGADEGGWSFLLRLSGLDGAPLAFESSAAIPPQWARGAAGKAASVRRQGALTTGLPPPTDLARDLKLLADGGAATAQRDYGLLLHYVAAEDPRLGAAERTLAFAAQVSGDVEGYRLAALAAGDDDKARKWLEQAVAPEVAPKGGTTERARALSQLGQVFDRLHRERRAEELWRAALAEDPGYFPATMRLAELATARGLPSRARALLDQVAERHPAVIAVLRARATLADRQDRDQEAEALYRTIAEASREDAGALRGLEVLARARGDIDVARGLLQRLIAGRPGADELIVEEAELLDGVGRSEEALAVLAVALAASPDQPALLELSGRVLHRLGRDPAALEAFRRSLELRPQDPALRAYAGSIAAALALRTGGASAPGADADPDDLARRFSVPVEELIARAAKAGRPDTDPAWVLLDQKVTRVHANGLSQSFSQRVVQVLDERGAREQGQAVVRYTPDSQSVEIKAARVHKGSGEIVEAASQSDQDTSEPWYGLYYDTRAQVVELPRLDPGDVIDIEYVISDIGSRNLFGDYFGDLEMLQEDMARMQTDVTLIAPRTRKLYFNEPRLPGARAVSLTESDAPSGDRVYHFHAEAVPKIRTEPGMPGLTSLGSYLHVSTFQSWEEMADWYRALVRDQLEPDDEIRKAVKATLVALAERNRAAGARSRTPADERARELQKIGAIYDLVVKSTRYVGLEFGIHGYKPYRVAQVFQRKFGDCKDKAALLVAMLKLAGVDASLVLVRTRRGGDIGPYPTSLAPFDHAIAWVPRYDLFLDGTAEFSGSGELPTPDQDVPVLILTDPRVGGRGQFVRTPVLPAERNHVSRTAEVTLAASGEATVKVAMEVAGEAAHDWRSHYQSPGDRRERLEKAENAAHPGARVTRVEFPSLEELEQPVRMEAELEVPAWARRSGSPGMPGATLSMPVLGREGELSRTYVRLSERQHDLVLGYPWRQDERLTITLPEGFVPSRIPAPQTIESPFGRFTLGVERSGARVIAVASLVVRRHRVSAAEYPEFRRFCLAVDRAVAQELAVTRE